MADGQNVDQATDNLESQVPEQSEVKTFTNDDLVRVGTKEHKSGYSKACSGKCRNKILYRRMTCETQI